MFNIRFGLSVMVNMGNKKDIDDEDIDTYALDVVSDKAVKKRKSRKNGYTFQEKSDVEEYAQDHLVPWSSESERIRIPKAIYDALPVLDANRWSALQKFIMKSSADYVLERVLEDLYGVLASGDVSDLNVTPGVLSWLDKVSDLYGSVMNLVSATVLDKDYGLHLKMLKEIEDEKEEFENEHESKMKELEEKTKEFGQVARLQGRLSSIRGEYADEIEGLKSQIAVLESDKQRLEDSLGGLANAEGMRKFTYWLSDWRSDYRSLDMRETLRMMATYCYGLGNDIEALKYENKQLKEKRHFFRR